MKQKDLAVIIAVCAVAAIISLVVARLLFATPQARQQKVEVVDKISTDFVLPDPKYINAQSYNPTQTITIGGTGSTTPFNGSAQ